MATAAPQRSSDPLLERLPAVYRRRAERLANDLKTGQITADQWQESMRMLITGLHVAAYIQGSGGQLTPAGRDILIGLVAAQVAFLVNWVAQLKATAVQESVRVIVARAQLYAHAVNATYQRAVTDRIGMPPLPAYAGDGSTRCLVNCRCAWRIVNLAPGDWDCTWTLRPAEHCPQCERRAAVWNPLQIRGGVIQPYDRTGLFA